MKQIIEIDTDTQVVVPRVPTIAITGEMATKMRCNFDLLSGHEQQGVLTEMARWYSAAVEAAPQPEQPKPVATWVHVSDRLPPLGVKVDLFSNGVVQDETYALDQADDGLGAGEYYWDRDDLEQCPPVNWLKDMWRERPLPPTPTEAGTTNELK